MPRFKIIGLLVLEKKILKVFAIYSHGGHLGHVTLTIYTNFHSLFLKMLHIKFGFDWPSGFRVLRRCLNIMVIHMYIAPGQGQKTLWVQNIFLNMSILSICSFLASFLPLIDIFLFFPIQMHGRPELTLP